MTSCFIWVLNLGLQDIFTPCHINVDKMTGASSMHRRDENASAYEVLVANVKGEDHLRDLGVEEAILMPEGKAVPVHDMKIVEAELHAFLTSSPHWNG
jgi:hypothetical protein